MYQKQYKSTGRINEKLYLIFDLPGVAARVAPGGALPCPEVQQEQNVIKSGFHRGTRESTSSLAQSSPGPSANQPACRPCDNYQFLNNG